MPYAEGDLIFFTILQALGMGRGAITACVGAQRGKKNIPRNKRELCYSGPEG